MIGRRPMGKRLVWVIAGAVALIVAGCCRSNGSSHTCGSTLTEEAHDGGPDGPVLCGTAVCENGDVCCYKKSPAIALCISPSASNSQGCEALDQNCSRPSDCPGGSAVSCCLKVTGEIGMATCRPTIACVSESGYLACEAAADCPSLWPTCMQVSETPDGDPFSVCR